MKRVCQTRKFGRGLLGKPPDDAYLNDLLRKLSLGDKTGAIVNQLSGGMKRRVLIAKALSHPLNEQGLVLKDLNTRQSSLENIFVDLVRHQVDDEPVGGRHSGTEAASDAPGQAV